MLEKIWSHEELDIAAVSSTKLTDAITNDESAAFVPVGEVVLIIRVAPIDCKLGCCNSLRLQQNSQQQHEQRHCHYLKKPAITIKPHANGSCHASLLLAYLYENRIQHPL